MCLYYCTIYHRIALWSGKTAQIMQEDVEFLITNKGITGQVINGSFEGIKIREVIIYLSVLDLQTIDEYAEVLSRRLASDKKLKHKSYFMTILVSVRIEKIFACLGLLFFIYLHIFKLHLLNVLTSMLCLRYDHVK